MTLRPFRLIFGTRRGLRLFVLHAFAAFGLVSAVIQFYSAVWEPQQSLPYPGLDSARGSGGVGPLRCCSSLAAAASAEGVWPT
jgi:hypothetical protein